MSWVIKRAPEWVIKRAPEWVIKRAPEWVIKSSNPSTGSDQKSGTLALDYCVHVMRQITAEGDINWSQGPESPVYTDTEAHCVKHGNPTNVIPVINHR